MTTEDVDGEPDVLYRGQLYELFQTEDFAGWRKGLRDRIAQKRINDRLVRLADGQFGDAKSVGEGIQELRFHFGPGYRVYFTARDGRIIILLAGGDKDSQSRDIARARQLAAEI